jgi:hypothetical protein
MLLRFESIDENLRPFFTNQDEQINRIASTLLTHSCIKDELSYSFRRRLIGCGSSLKQKI